MDLVELSWNRRDFVRFLRLFDSWSKPLLQSANHRIKLEGQPWMAHTMQWVLPFDLSLFKRCIEQNKNSVRTPPAIMWSSTQVCSFFFPPEHSI
jgi:hypothetical protein